MNREEYEERRRALEEQHRADIALLNAAHELRLRSLERIWGEGVEGEPSPAAAALARKPMRERYSVGHDLLDSLPKLPTVFDRHDVLRALGYVPARTTLLRALERLVDQGEIAVEEYSPGGVTTVYRKLAPSQ
jgi:hypothetical protein